MFHFDLHTCNGCYVKYAINVYICSSDEILWDLYRLACWGDSTLSRFLYRSHVCLCHVCHMYDCVYRTIYTHIIGEVSVSLLVIDVFLLFVQAFPAMEIWDNDNGLEKYILHVVFFVEYISYKNFHERPDCD